MRTTICSLILSFRLSLLMLVKKGKERSICCYSSSADVCPKKYNSSRGNVCLSICVFGRTVHVYLFLLAFHSLLPFRSLSISFLFIRGVRKKKERIESTAVVTHGLHHRRKEGREREAAGPGEGESKRDTQARRGLFCSARHLQTVLCSPSCLDSLPLFPPPAAATGSLSLYLPPCLCLFRSGNTSAKPFPPKSQKREAGT